MSFEIKNYEVVRNVISSDLCDYLNKGFELLRISKYIENGLDPFNQNQQFNFKDDQVKNCFVDDLSLFFEPLLVYLQPMVEKITQRSLYPTYSYSRMYFKGAYMGTHVDRPSCEYSCTVNLLSEPKPWKIYFLDSKNDVVPIKLFSGDCIVYKGTQLQHWRLPFKGNQINQVFLHYVDSNGPYCDFKYDKRKFLGLNF